MQDNSDFMGITITMFYKEFTVGKFLAFRAFVPKKTD